ncbi:MAG: TetR/AcrR family transcriptional regulator [Bacteroidota bacterium]
MKKTKERILQGAKELFNAQGVANVSLRKIAASLKISHSNLIYHFKTKNELIEHLHQELLHIAKLENQKLRQEKNRILGLLRTMEKGFATLWDYRFFMIDLNFIMKENEALHSFFLEVETLRSKMYQEEIECLIGEGLMRGESYVGEYAQLIKRIRIFSDYWIASAQIYDQGEYQRVLKEYVQLFMSIFYPYLTVKGKKDFHLYIGVKGLG